MLQGEAHELVRVHCAWCWSWAVHVARTAITFLNLPLVPFSICAQETCTQTLQGPYLHAASYPAWDAVVVSHRKANDEHIMLVQVRGRAFLVAPQGSGSTNGCMLERQCYGSSTHVAHATLPALLPHLPRWPPSPST